MSRDTPRAIAKRLTPAQRRDLLTLPRRGDDSGALVRISDLRNLGLVRELSSSWDRFGRTDLGDKVAAIVEASEDGAA